MLRSFLPLGSFLPFCLGSCAGQTGNNRVGSAYSGEVSASSGEVSAPSGDEADSEDLDAPTAQAGVAGQTREEQGLSQWEAEDPGAEGEVLDEDDDLESVSEEAIEAEIQRVGEQQRELARLALHQSSGNDNHLGLAVAVSERAADLPWILAIKNRSERRVRLAALPDLVRLEVSAPQEAEGLEPTTIKCERDLPRRLDSADQVELEPGQFLYYPFDPRRYCSESETLQEGSEVRLIYGFPTQTKKLWKAGKLTEVEAKQTDPFVAEADQDPDKPEQDELVGIKHLVSEPFVLGKTYPLDQIALLPRGSLGGDGRDSAAPPPRLRITVRDLGTLRDPAESNVVITVTNVSNETFPLFLRRELITYEIIGRWASMTCRIHPDDRAPDPAAFATLSPGESRTLVTRLAEACPKETWKYPGTYGVSARLDANVRGREYGLDAFVGSVTSDDPARLVVLGKRDRPLMRIASE